MNIVKNESYPIFDALIHHAVSFLIVNLISMPNQKAVRAAINHEPHARIGRNGHMDSVTHMKRGVCIPVRTNLSTCQ